MAKTIKRHKGHIIKEATKRDNTTFKYLIFKKDDTYTVEWECDSIEEAIEWIG